MAMEKTLFAKYRVPLLNFVDHTCSVGVLVKLGDSGAECGLFKDKRYMPEDVQLVAISI